MEEIDKDKSWIKAVNAIIKNSMYGALKTTDISTEDVSNQLVKEFIGSDVEKIRIDSGSSGIIDDHPSLVYTDHTDSSVEPYEVVKITPAPSKLKIMPAEEIKLSDDETIGDWIIDDYLKDCCLSSAVSTATRDTKLELNPNPFIDDAHTNDIYELPRTAPVSKPKKRAPVKNTEITKIWDNL